MAPALVGRLPGPPFGGGSGRTGSTVTRPRASSTAASTSAAGQSAAAGSSATPPGTNWLGKAGREVAVALLAASVTAAATGLMKLGAGSKHLECLQSEVTEFKDSVNKRFDSVDAELKRINSKLDKEMMRMDSKLERISSKLDTLVGYMQGAGIKPKNDDWEK